MSPTEKQLRRDLLKIEENEINYSTLFGETKLYSIPTDICVTFLGIYPKPTVKELRIVLNPICYYFGINFDHHSPIYPHRGTCTDQADCGPGWIYNIPGKPGYCKFDKKIADEMEAKEKEVRHQLMEHIVDSRKGIMNTNSTYYQYFEDKKERSKWLSSTNHQ